MTDKEILKRMWDKRGDLRVCEDIYGFAKEIDDRGYLRQLKGYLEEKLKSNKDEEVVKAYILLEKVLIECAKWDFESFLLIMEWNREPRVKFYMPRRKALCGVVKEMQRLADGEIELLAISMPPGVGKSTLGTFYLCWLAGRNPELPNLMFSHNASIIGGVYKECLRFMQDEEYRFKDVFQVPIVSTNAKDLRIDLGDAKKFETLEFTSVGSQNAGGYRAMNLLYCDDLVDGFETAMSIERLNKLWSEYTVDARQRKQGDRVKELHIATRWSVHDVIGRLENMYEGNKKAKFISVPALDKHDKSNFDFPYNLGFTTKMYLEQREVMDEVSWKCLYMNEPIEREGQLYAEEELMRYYDLPVIEPDSVLAICDTKNAGDDYAFLPVMYQYGDYYYLEDCVFDNGKPENVDARLLEILCKHNVDMCQFESNLAGGRVSQKISEGLKERGKKTVVTNKYTTANKETKIIVNSAWVKSHIYFKDKTMYRPNSDYGNMLRNLCSYSMVARNKHDDAPDGLAMFSEYVQNRVGVKATLIKRPF